MTYQNEDYPRVDEIIIDVREYVEDVCRGEWPEDEWFGLGSNWSINVWEEECGRRGITVFRDTIGPSGHVETDLTAGISIIISS